MHLDLAFIMHVEVPWLPGSHNAQTKVSNPPKNIKARKPVALPSMEAGRGAFGLSSPAFMLVAGIAEDFLLLVFEMSDPIALTPQAAKGR